MMLSLHAFSQSKQSDEYYNKGVELYNARKYKQAIPYFEKSSELDLQELEEGNIRREYSIHWLASCYYKLGNESKAAEIYPGEYMVPTVDRRLTVESDALSDKVVNAINSGDYINASKDLEKMIAIEKRIEGDNHPWLANDYYYYGYCQLNLGDYDTAEKFMKQYADIYESNYGDNSLQYATAIKELAELYFIKHNYDKAAYLGEKICDICATMLGKNSEEYLVNMSNTARYYDYAGKYKRALECQKEIVKSLNPAEDDPMDYIICISNLALYNQHCGYYQEALKLYNVSLQEAESGFGKNSKEYMTVLSDISLVYGEMGNSLKEIELQQEILKIAEAKYNSEYEHIQALVRLSESWMNLGSLVEAKDYILKAYDLMNKNNYEKTSEEYLTVLSDVVGVCAIEKDMQSALKYCGEKLEIYKQKCGKDSYDYLIGEIDYALLIGDMGNFDMSISTIEKNIALMKKNGYRVENSIYCNLADMYVSQKDYNQAWNCYKSAAEVASAAKDTIGYVKASSQMALIKLTMGDWYSAVSFFTDSTMVKDFMNQGNSNLSAKNTKRLMAYLGLLENWNIVSESGLRSKSIAETMSEDYKVKMRSQISLIDSLLLVYNRDFRGENSFDYLDHLYNVAYTKLFDGNFGFAQKNIPLWFNWIVSYIKTNFSTMTTQERFNFMQLHNDKLDPNLLAFSYRTRSPKLIGTAYDGQLFVKGLSLNAELEIQKLIEKSGNKRMKELYMRIKNSRAIIDRLYQVPENQRTINADSLQKGIENLERELVASSSEIGDYTKNLSVSWENIRNKIKDNEVAIEFGQFYEDGRLFFVALVLKKGMSNPEMVELFKNQNIDSISQSVFYTTPVLYNQIWSPLQKYLDGTKNVYFSPCGKFHTIAIEYLPDENGEIFAKKYNAYRLSSTRELALEKKINSNKKASVYGGIIYDFSEGDWQDLKEYKNEIEHEFRDIPDLAESFRAGISFLKGAKKEAETVTDVLRNGNYKVSYWSETYATEESFKKLSGSGIKILHIATHGFYEPENKKYGFIDLLSDSNNSKEDRSLSRSGLLLAGAASAINPEKRKQIPEGVDDGILTAKEISRLDFKGLDLVVLSACQTGLGEVTGEGVFGLQRGFKKAGAQTIVMSLWKVDDNATQLLMTEFYKNLVAGKTKREAFIAAQNSVKEKYTDPDKWAAFVMVDGLN